MPDKRISATQHNKADAVLFLGFLRALPYHAA
jgi:hypothetical protein